MKTLLFMSILLSALLPNLSFACNNGDKSKILLVLNESDAGEENVVIGEIDSLSGDVEITRSPYMMTSIKGNFINVKSITGHKYSFDLRKVTDANFCYQVIFGL